MEGLFRLQAGRDALAVTGGVSLRLLTAAEMLEARREGSTLAGADEGARALWVNAAILARALVRGGAALYPSARAVAEALSVSQIQRLAALWAAFDREENPGLGISQEEVEALKKAWSTRGRSALNGVYSGLLGRFLPRRG